MLPVQRTQLNFRSRK